MYVACVRLHVLTGMSEAVHADPDAHDEQYRRASNTDAHDDQYRRAVQMQMMSSTDARAITMLPHKGWPSFLDVPSMSEAVHAEACKQSQCCPKRIGQEIHM